MKKFKLFIIATVFACFSPLFFACGETPKLRTPDELIVDNSTYTILWQEVENADYYILEINGKTYQTASNSFPASNIIAGSGVYSIRVSASTFDGDYLTSNFSEIYQFSNLLKLDAPVVSIENNILIWQPVDNAEFYTVVVNGVSHITTKNSFSLIEQTDISQYLITGQNNTFTVYCSQTSNYLKSDVSNTVSYYIASNQNAPKNLNVFNEGNSIKLSYGKVSTAQSYTLKINNNEYQIIDNIVDITDKISNYGNYTISVKCNEVLDGTNIKYAESPYSTEFVYEHKPDIVNRKVQNLNIENNVLTFDALQDTMLYKIVVGNIEVYSATNEYDLSTLDLVPNNYAVTVYALVDNYSSLASDEIVFKKTCQLLAPTIYITTNNDNVILNISSVAHASAYKVLLNNQVIIESTIQLQVNITSYIEQVVNEIKVIAVGNDIYLDSVASNVATHITLSAPSNISVDAESKLLTFDAVVGAVQYEIKVNGVSYVTTNTSYDLSNICVQLGVYSIEIASNDGQNTSSFENYKFVISEQLEAPTNLTITEINGRVLLNFNEVANAKYKIIINGQAVADKLQLTENTNIDITDDLTLGNNIIIVVSVGDGEVYLDSNPSSSIEHVKVKNLEQVSNIQVYAEAGKYYLSFDGVEDADYYNITIVDDEDHVVFDVQNTTELHFDIDQYITKTESYKISVKAVQTTPYYSESINILSQAIKAYTKAEYQSQTFFYDGHDYTYCLNSVYEFEEFIYYAVLYRLETAEVYLNFEYDNIQNAYTSQESLINKYIPTITNYGVDLNSDVDVITQIFSNNENLNKLSEIIYLLERSHDQIYLYFSANCYLTSQKSNRVYTINFDYIGEEEASKVNQKPTTTQADVPVSYVERQTARNFAIDSLPTAPVKTVAQLLMVVQNGRRPQFIEPNTVAEQTYNKAREVLSKICSDGMTDHQKALAIYEWIIVNNQYDNTTYESASGTPFTPENLNEMSFYASGMLLNNLAVCKGISQAFALMCNIEGIQTIETFGLVGAVSDWSTVDFSVNLNDYSPANFAKLQALMILIQNAGGLGAHSWNRIYLDAGDGVKRWYIADATWDDVIYGGYEYVSYEYFLVNDDKIVDNRKELYPHGTFYHRTDSNGNIIDYSANGTYDYYADTINKSSSLITSQNDANIIVLNMQANGLTGCAVMVGGSISASTAKSYLTSAMQANGYDTSQYKFTSYGKYIWVFKL